MAIYEIVTDRHKNCPKCGRKLRFELEYGDPFGPAYRVHCDTCGDHGWSFESFDKAEDLYAQLLGVK